MEIAAMITSTINFKLTVENGRTELQPGASQELDDLKNTFWQLVERLPGIQEKMQIELRVHRRNLHHIRHCTILPELGFLVAVGLDEESGEVNYLGRGTPDDAWDVSFIDKDVAYCKNSYLLDLDEQYGDLLSKIAGEHSPSNSPPSK
jgi:DNA mismatch repair protein MSH5